MRVWALENKESPQYCPRSTSSECGLFSFPLSLSLSSPSCVYVSCLYFSSWPELWREKLCFFSLLFLSLLIVKNKKFPRNFLFDQEATEKKRDKHKLKKNLFEFAFVCACPHVHHTHTVVHNTLNTFAFLFSRQRQNKKKRREFSPASGVY